MTSTSGYVVNQGPSVEGFLLPAVDGEVAGFLEGTLAGELRVQVCTSCARLRHPPRPMCPHCHSTGRAWKRVSGRATLWSFIVAHPPVLPAYAGLAPYNVIVAAIDEDPTIRFVGNLVTGPEGPINEIDPADIAIGERIEVCFTAYQRVDGSVVALPRWRRAPV
ncbi:MAG TPA: OB-fold domain-containing protein [Acidimicrobiales bacterium]|nr:OB-fold domain-containing protein [Acidimicrobiales bacterium]